MPEAWMSHEADDLVKILGWASGPDIEKEIRFRCALYSKGHSVSLPTVYRVLQDMEKDSVSE